MFTVYKKSVGGREHDRYFQKWENAKAALLRDATDAKRAGWTTHVTDDYFNSQKGFYVYGIYGVTDKNEPFALSLIEAYFED